MVIIRIKSLAYLRTLAINYLQSWQSCLTAARKGYVPLVFGIILIVKFIEAVINKEVVVHISFNNLLSDKQFRYHFYRSTEVVLHIVTHISSETNDGSHNKWNCFA